MNWSEIVPIGPYTLFSMRPVLELPGHAAALYQGYKPTIPTIHSNPKRV